MKNIFSKKSFIAISAIIVAGALFFGLPAVCSSMDDMGGGPCGLQTTVRSDTSYVNIPILNNHHPKTETITQVYIAVPAASPCYKSGMNCLSETRVKEIKFGDTIAFNASSSWCCCIGSTRHSDGHLYTLDTSYGFSDAKVVCRITLDVAAAPSGNYTVTYYYTLPDDATVRSNELTFTIP